MSKTILLEQFHLTVLAPVGLVKTDYRAMLRTLQSKRFRASLRDGLRRVFRRHPSLKRARFRIDR